MIGDGVGTGVRTGLGVRTGVAVGSGSGVSSGVAVAVGRGVGEGVGVGVRALLFTFKPLLKFPVFDVLPKSNELLMPKFELMSAFMFIRFVLTLAFRLELPFSPRPIRSQRAPAPMASRPTVPIIVKKTTMTVFDFCGGTG